MDQMKRGKIDIKDFKFFWALHGFERISEKEFESLFRRIERNMGQNITYADFLDFFLLK